MDKKMLAADQAAEMIKDGMVVGLGTGSTAYWAIHRLSQRIKEGLQIRAVPTSEHTKQMAMDLDIPLVTFADIEHVDVTIDGADEISPDFHLIKGGGGALYREKVVAQQSKIVMIVADDSKQVEQLGAFPLPVEIVPFGWEPTARQIQKLGCRTTLRKTDERAFTTDNGNWILDCDFGRIDDPSALHRSLKMLTGVVETGLFLHAADLVFIGTNDGVIRKERSDTMKIK
ncbi:ribose-5-phosphate isomerase RpiA [Paenibacillus sp. LMG 31456]|uniref:Ribose-5-phosphate isomerase A n=1 Tax=Paenibacillus foliorum TaxID=2654974 RepID=A0A972GV70_9BACL|nr:ribose-5-phosphate isomerase RpiA [Paenibacillus foliorum]NOU94412.1 ribose-5-phosphate isomerase RpiA [Paenibacillus foliorum]